MRNYGNRDDHSRPRRDFGRRDFSRRSYENDGGQRQMYKAVCTECRKDCEVPFEPTGSKPVYCNDCFRRNNTSADSRRFQDRGSSRPGFERRSEPRPQNNDQFDAINRKLDQILEILTANPVVEKKEIEKPMGVTALVQKKVKTPKNNSSNTDKQIK